MSDHFSRRRILRVAASAALLGQLGPDRADARTVPGNPRRALEIYRKMRFALHEEPIYWWIRATKYGLVDSELIPLYQMEIASFFKVIATDDDSFTTKSLEIVYSTNVETGELLEEWTNPYTKEVVPVHHTPIGPSTIRYTVEGQELPTELPGATLESSKEFGPLWFEGDAVWLRDDATALVTQLDGKSKPFRVYDWSTYSSPIAAVEDPGSPSAPCNNSFTAISDWQRWMAMEDQPGNLVSRGFGQKVSQFEQLPTAFRTLLRQAHPAIAEDPIKALDLPPFRFER